MALQSSSDLPVSTFFSPTAESGNGVTIPLRSFDDEESESLANDPEHLGDHEALQVAQYSSLPNPVEQLQQLQSGRLGCPVAFALSGLKKWRWLAGLKKWCFKKK